MVQLSTPEEMVLNPADDYVAEFAKKAPRDRIISAGAIMTKGAPSDEESSGTVRASDRIGSIANQVLTADKPVTVIDDNDQPVGSLGRAAITKALFGEVES